ncbi:predicted protein [Histoplasma mississippiense (nom. inval.)]|uniref:predicted protein n=1 Tax=Ajellomyces capsulatus (strain NAm1 / WU24) TaxID=2059318 RepID=UPI000157D5CE|nr:predicted protein [Histoplasma mississippiense (nom. inval.)]EDN05470.1 predicted protein [Histoplasma mississippiense (nom. inval.)]
MESLDTVAQARRDIEQNIAHMDDLYSALLQMRQDIEENIGTLEEPLQHLSNAKTTGDIQKYLQEFSIEFHKLFLLFEKLAGFTSCALSIGIETGELGRIRWHITSLWEDYGLIQQIMYTCSLCRHSQEPRLRQRVEYLLEQMGDLQVVCEERSKHLKQDLFHSAY